MKRVKSRGLILVTAAMLVLVFFAYGDYKACDDGIAFDKKLWDQGLESTIGGKRFEIAKVLSKCEVLVGMSEDELVKMLGRPDRTFSDTHLNYWLGPERESYINIDSDWLSIWVENDKVVKTKLRTD